MEQSTKIFDRDSYNTNDPAKYIILELLKKQGFTAIVNPDTYGVDILASKGDNYYMFEVEVKHSWSGSVFPFSKVQIPDRKTKFLKPNTRFILLNKEYTHLVLVKAEDIDPNSLVEVPNKYVSEGEFFYQVDKFTTLEVYIK